MLPWTRANASAISGFSALGWYIARELFKMSGETVPVGIVQSDIPGANISLNFGMSQF
jgi:hypothetical protein